jgi:23S rRNA (guanosine2251-2'-O)-methyltransferase
VIVYGRNAVREALRGRREVSHVWATEQAARDLFLERVAPPVDVVADARQLLEICGSDGHQGVCAETGPYPYADGSSLLEPEDALVVVLDEIQDPQNLGAICRSAECAGATGVVIPERRSAEVTPAVCKASAGAVEHLPVAQVRNVADFLAEAKRAGAWCYGAAAEGTTDYALPDYDGRVALVLGGEGKGLRPRVAGACDALVSLPLRGQIGSLNVSAAAAVLLYAVERGRRAS